MKLVKKTSTLGPRDQRGVLQARILAAARSSFAESGSAGTTIRTIARSADVDPALIYHYFGSKEDLLDAATEPPPRWLEAVAASWTTPTPHLGRALVEVMLDSWSDPEIGPVLRATVLTAAHEPRIREKLRHVVERSLTGVSGLAVDEHERQKRSALIASQIIGLALMRFIWQTEPLAGMDRDELLDAVAPNLQRYLTEDLCSPTPE